MTRARSVAAFACVRPRAATLDTTMATSVKSPKATTLFGSVMVKV